MPSPSSPSPSVARVGVAPSRGGTAERGVALVLTMFLTVMIAGLSIGLVYEGLAARGNLDRHEHNLRALEIAEAGIVRAEMEIRSQVDSGSDGIGNVSGAYGNGTYVVVATPDPVSPDRMVLRAEASQGHSTRRFEVGIRRRVSGMFQESLYSLETLTLASTTTDAYDSRLGAYALQAVQSDAYGAFADYGGSVGSNEDIVLNGSANTVRGNAIPGPLMQVVAHGSPVVTGDQVPRQVAFEFPPVSQAEFEAALQANDNESISVEESGGGNGNGNGKGGSSGGGNGGGKSGPYNPDTMSLTLSGNATATIPGGTYFFRRIDMGAHSTLRITGPARIYVTEAIDLQSGASILASRPGDAQLFVHPYPLPDGVAPAQAVVELNGQSTISMALYAPGGDLSLGGGNEMFGSALARRIDLHGGNFFHYDKALGDVGIYSVATVERLYWREVTEPRR